MAVELLEQICELLTKGFFLGFGVLVQVLLERGQVVPQFFPLRLRKFRRFFPIPGEFIPKLRILRVELVLHPVPPVVVSLGSPDGR